MKTSLTFYAPNGIDPFSNFTTKPKAAKVRLLIKALTGAISGGYLDRDLLSGLNHPSVVAGTAYATATVTLATVLAADTVTINGAALTAANGSPTAEQFDMSGTDAADATSFVNAVNVTSTAALITGLVRASNIAGTVTFASSTAGDTVTVAGVTFTAVTATATNVSNEFSIAGNDTADAAALVALINAHPVTKELVFASNSSAVVTVRQLPFGPTAALGLSSSNATRLAVVAMAATGTVLLCARDKGKEGNCMTIASSNGTRLAIGASATRLTGGTDSVLTF